MPPDQHASEDIKHGNCRKTTFCRLAGTQTSTLAFTEEFLISMLQIEEQARPSALDIQCSLGVAISAKVYTSGICAKIPEFYCTSPDYEDATSQCYHCTNRRTTEFCPRVQYGCCYGPGKEKIRELIQKIGLMNMQWKDHLEIKKLRYLTE